MLSHFNCVRLFVTLCAVARQAPLFTRFSWQEYWSVLPFPSSGDFPNPGTEPKSPPVSSIEGGFFTADPPGNLSLQMAQFHFFLWLIFHYIYVPYLLYPFPCWWTFRLLPCLGCCKQCCYEHWGTPIFSNQCFHPFWIYAQKLDYWIIW